MNPTQIRPSRRLVAALAFTVAVGAAALEAMAQISPLDPSSVTSIANPHFPAFDFCQTGLIELDTGRNHLGALAGPLTIAPGALHHPVPDEGWRIVHDPFGWTHEPRPARVIQKHVSWAAPLPGTEWIGSTDTAIEEFVGGTHGYFVFETSFGARSALPALLQITARVDDVVDFFVNPPSLHAITSLPPGSIPPWLAPSYAGSASGSSTSTTVAKWLYNLRVGKNHIYARVRRTGGFGDLPLGLNVKGTLRSQVGSATLLHPACCLRNTIIGRKYNDFQFDFTNSNNLGVTMSGIPIRATRTIPALPALSVWTISDGRGDWSFLDLPEGTYVINEPPYQPCTQTVPLFPPFYSVNLPSGLFADGPQARSLTNLANPTQFEDQGFGNWCDNQVFLYMAGSDTPPEMGCVQWASQTQTGTDPVLTLSFYNNSICTIDRVRVQVLHPIDVTVAQAVVDLVTPVVPSGSAVLPTIYLTIPAAHAGEAVCVRLSFISLVAGNEVICSQHDVCVWATCVTSVTGGGGGGPR